MKRFTKTLLTAAIFSLSASSAIVTEAGCHGRSGGYSGGGYSGRYHSGVSSYHSHNAYHYRQPTYVQPLQPVVYSEPVVQQTPQPQYLSQYGAAPAPSSAISANGFPAGPTTPAQPQRSPQPQMIQPQQQFPQQQMIPQQTTTPLQPQIQPSVAAENAAELSALQALGAFAPPQTVSQQAPQTATSAMPVSQSLVGSWTARLSNGATVLLNLQADGTFNWTATNASGSTTAFQGQYVADNGSLVLNRSSDNQRLTGSAAMNGSQTFSFKMSNSNAASLEFHRS
jgi:hypothetical protein